MAQAKIQNVNLQLRLDGGMVGGKQKVIVKAIPGIALNASDDSILKVANTLAGLQTKDMVDARKVAVYTLSE